MCTTTMTCSPCPSRSQHATRRGLHDLSEPVDADTWQQSQCRGRPQRSPEAETELVRKTRVLAACVHAPVVNVHQHAATTRRSLHGPHVQHPKRSAYPAVDAASIPAPPHRAKRSKRRPPVQQCAAIWSDQNQSMANLTVRPLPLPGASASHIRTHYILSFGTKTERSARWAKRRFRSRQNKKSDDGFPVHRTATQAHKPAAKEPRLLQTNLETRRWQMTISLLALPLLGCAHTP